MTTSNIKILPCELADMEACVDIFNESFAKDPIVYYMHPNSDPKILKDRSLKGYEKSFAAPGMKYFKAVHEMTGEIVAFSNWNYPHTPDPSAPDPETSIRNEVLPPGSNDELVVEFLIKFLRARQKWLIPQEHYYMRILAVRPEYQRKGIGSLLLEPVLEIIDREKAKSYITASPMGLGLYLKYGWKEVDEIHIDFGPYGGGKDRTAVLMREPKVVVR